MSHRLVQDSLLVLPLGLQLSLLILQEFQTPLRPLLLLQEQRLLQPLLLPGRKEGRREGGMEGGKEGGRERELC